MAKKSSIEKNNRRRHMTSRDLKKRTELKTVIMNRESSPEERMQAVLKLAEMPRNGAKVRIRNRCEVTGRPRAYYRKLKMSRVALRELGNMGMIPGLVKSSW
ncbi:30S ribosomal protein S14 [Pinisolibacter aquiterrae]|uniref:30S ribosomal protein S14 n=1 Tax=Pinisolibacter aquiterrae TaxID=2815579 RepID=UPI001C3D1142|nr:30S ribosomal protein S14 [Pinisolibacter aquiterrae]MBV5264061.1 30S ribosomal protein S14 [Pinisolibacter aquiterrae]MCC8233844.1 30S ribosomal protein S14 [Pinisolibacter aquiterrae]